MSTISPIAVKNHLAGTPGQPPQFSVEVGCKNGRALQVSDPQSIRAMIALMDMQAVMGGAASHWGGPAALSEMWSALHALVFESSGESRGEWHENFHVINDAGHCENGLYAIKANYGFADLSIESLKGFRSIKSPLSGHGEAHLFPQGVLMSNGPLGSSLPQAQGLAFADALTSKKRLTVTTISDGACMEGEAKEALSAIPGFAAQGKMAPFVLIISDNNTKLSGRIDEQSFSMGPSFEALESLGWRVLNLEQGNNLQACVQTLEEAFELARQNPNQPVALRAKTIKGFGVKKTEEAPSGGHGFPLKKPEELTSFLSEIYKGAEVPSDFIRWQQELVDKASAKASAPSSAVKTIKVQVGVSEALSQMAKEGYPVYSVSSDLAGSTGLAGFQKNYPDQYVDVGIAESNMLSVAAGLSKAGFIPVVDTFAQFGVTKGALPFIMANLSEAPMISIFSHAGFQDAADGASHQALTYFSMTSAVPNTQVICLSSRDEAYALVSQAVKDFAQARRSGKTPKNYVFFLGRETFLATFKEGLEYKLGRAQTVFDNSDEHKKSVTIVAAGPLLQQALIAAPILKDKGIGTIVINPSTINEPDIDTILTAVKKTKGLVVTVEDHQLTSGMGSILAHKLAQSGEAIKMKSLGVNGVFGQSAYTAIELYSKHEMDSLAIIKAAEKLT